VGVAGGASRGDPAKRSPLTVTSAPPGPCCRPAGLDIWPMKPIEAAAESSPGQATAKRIPAVRYRASQGQSPNSLL